MCHTQSVYVDDIIMTLISPFYTHFTVFSHVHVTLLCTQCFYTGIPVAGSILLLFDGRMSLLSLSLYISYSSTLLLFSYIAHPSPS